MNVESQILCLRFKNLSSDTLFPEVMRMMRLQMYDLIRSHPLQCPTLCDALTLASLVEGNVVIELRFDTLVYALITVP